MARLTTLCWILFIFCVLPAFAQLPLSCDFEGGNICTLIQSSGDNQDWTVQNAPTGTTNTGPQSGAAGTSFFIYYETSDPVPTGAVARLETPALGASGTVCLRFYYHMYGEHIDRLEVFVQPGSSFSQASSVISWEGDQGDQWLEAELNVNLPNTNSRIVWEAERGGGIRGDISLDQIAISRGACGNLVTPTFSCGFESADLCGWEQSDSDQLDWTRFNAATPSGETGPSSAGAGSWYMYLEATNQDNGDVAILQSPGISFSGDVCVDFLSHMYGSDIRELRVGTSRSTALTVTGDQGNQWIRRSTTVNIASGDRVLFTAVRGNDYRGDIAIDAVTIRAGSCGSAPPATTPRPGDTGNLPFSCTFEGGNFCGMEQSSSDVFDWTAQTGGTTSSNTGPDSAQQGQTYIYIEASTPRNEGDRAILQTPQLTYTGDVCVRFYYHARGSHIGRLLVYNSRTGQGNPYLDVTSAQGNDWNLESQETSIQSGDRVVFLGETGNGVEGDIALDNLRISVGACSSRPPEVNPGIPFNVRSCDMESGTSGNCRVEQSTADNFNWLYISDNTPSGAVHIRRINGVAYPLTGPRRAQSGSNYIFTEASGKRAGEVSRLIFQGSDFQRGGDNCLRFSFNMNGYHQGSLVVYVIRSGRRVELWSVSGDRCQDWCSVAVEANMNSVSQIGMDATMTGFFSGDTAVDSISMSPGRCDNPPVGTAWRCTFEINNGPTLCGMEVDTSTSIDWVLWQGRTPSDETGPSSARNGPYYVYMEASAPRQNGQTARIMSPVLGVSGTVCVRFDYHMYGWHMGSLRLARRTSGGSETVAWTQSGDQGNAWRSQATTVTSLSGSDRISFVGVRGTAFSSDIALDNIRVTIGAC